MWKTARGLGVTDAALAILIFLTASTSSAPAHALQAGAVLANFSNVISRGYQAAPALMLGLAVAAGLLILTLVSLAVQPRALPLEKMRRIHGEPGEGGATDQDAQPVRVPAHPFLEIEGASGARCAILRDMLRIGREDDNDIRIPSRAVQRYHAAIYREEFDDWHIAALAGGNVLVVNGRRCSEARLVDGDVIQLGPGTLRFRGGHA